VAVTGVSGSGKSTLVDEILYRALASRLHGTRVRAGAHTRIDGLEQIDKVINIDQSPIGRTPRSNPATYTKTFDLVRDLFTQTPDARVRGFGPGRFSFNVRGGRCEACEGDGIVRIEMHFLPDVYVPCEVCKGKRYNRETLEVLYKGRSIADVLEMTVTEALSYFENVPRIRKKLQTLHDVGLGYVHLGQPATTLSGGEAQRVKLAAELSRRDTGKTVYILDEPTVGLHFADVERLLEVLHRLVDAGNTVIVIEHNLDVIKTADWIIDLGPEGGELGGQVIAEGPPEAVAAQRHSYTGQFLRRTLAGPSEFVLAGNGRRRNGRGNGRRR
jgi:excinuclease ABC subunit A